MSEERDEHEGVHKEALEVFQRCVEREERNRQEFRDDVRFARLGEQWPETIRRQRETEGRPCLTINKLPAFIRQVVNDARQNKPSIVVHPADSAADPDTAEIIGGLIRNIEVSSNAEVAYDTALDFAVTGGWGYFRINTAFTSDDSFDQDLMIERIANPLSVYADPDDQGADSANWNHAFVVDTLSRDDFEKKYKGADPVDWEFGEYAKLPEGWCDGERVVVAEYWRRREVSRQIVMLSNEDVVDLEVYEENKDQFELAGISIVGQPRDVRSHKVTQYIMSGAEVLDTVEWAGRYIPIVPVYGEDIIVDGERFFRSLVRDAKDPQRRVNYHTSTVTELVSLAPKTPFIGRIGAFKTDRARWETANTESHAYLEYDGQDAPQRQPYAGVPAGEMQQVLLANDDMKAVMGLHDASLGIRSNETSGRAIMARQQEGDVSTFNFIDNLSRAIRHAGRILIDMIPHVYSVPRVLRVMGPDGEPKSVAVNQEVPVEPGEGADEQGEALRIYNLTAGKYDLVVKTGPSFTSRREEAANQMIELMRAYPPAAPVIGDMLARNLDWPGAEEISKRLEALLPPQVRQAVSGKEGQPRLSPEAQQAHAMLQQATQVVQQQQQQMQQLQADMEALKEEKAIEAEKVRIAAYDAETKRMEAQARINAQMMGAMNPNPQQSDF